jgi:endonuclease/exonuclease/phosphatase family metal-dependent hydrolase
MKRVAILLALLLAAEAGGGELTVVTFNKLFNTHWDHQNQPSREKAGRLLAQRIDARRHQDEPVIVTGDFNATEGNPGVAYLLGQQVPLAGGSGPEKCAAPLRSSFLELHPDVADRRTFHGWQGGKEGKTMIDHILVSEEWTVVRAWIDCFEKAGVWPADHYPVGAVLARKPANAKSE